MTLARLSLVAEDAHINNLPPLPSMPTIACHSFTHPLHLFSTLTRQDDRLSPAFDFALIAQPAVLFVKLFFTACTLLLKPLDDINRASSR